MARRDYDGLNGKECLELILLQIREVLEKEGRLAQSQVYHNVSITVEIGLDSYPHEPRLEVFSAKTSVGKVPEGKKASKKEVGNTRSYEVPDLAREEIEAAKSRVSEDVNLLTQAEGRG